MKMTAITPLSPTCQPHEAPVSRAYYILDSIKLLRKKLEKTMTKPIVCEVKSGNVVMELNTSAFQMVRKALVEHFRGEDSDSPYRCGIVSTKCDHNDSVESEVIKIVHGKRRSTSVYKRHAFIMNIYRTTNKIMIHGSGVDAFLAKEMPAIVDLIDINSDKIVYMNKLMKSTIQNVLSNRNTHAKEAT
jgi:hypothetical protein